MKCVALIALALHIAALGPASASTRSSSAVASFKKANPCPSNGNLKGACPGYIVDHIQPLCAGGPDKPSNMQWQTVHAAKEKDKTERALCRKR